MLAPRRRRFTRPCACWSPTDSSRRTSSRASRAAAASPRTSSRTSSKGSCARSPRRARPGLHIVDRDTIEGELLALFHDGRRLASADLAPVRGYLVPDDPDRPALDRRRAQLAAQLAELFDEYAYSRPEMLAAWRKGGLIAGWDEPLQRWQRDLWLALFGRGGTLADPDRATLPDFFARTAPGELRVSGPAHVFGISFVARLYRSIFASLGRAAPLYVYVLNPCRELWEDLQPARRTARGPRAAAGRTTRQLALDLGDASAAAAASAAADENPLLALWGRPGRDSIRLYNDLSDCNFHERFEDPAAGMPRPTLLATLQREVLERAPRSREAAPADASLVMFGAPDPRRELETVAAEISVARAARRHAALRRLRGRRPGGVGGHVSAARARGAHRRIRAAAHRARSAVARGGPHPGGDRAAAGAAVRAARPARSAPARDAPRGRAAVPRRRSGAVPGAV